MIFSIEQLMAELAVLSFIVHKISVFLSLCSGRFTRDALASQIEISGCFLTRVMFIFGLGIRRRPIAGI